MSKLYEIDKQIEDLILNSVDPETGELVIDPEQMAALQMEREQKVENIALYYKDMLAEADMIKAEIDALSARMKAAKGKAESLKKYLEYALNGEKFSTPKVACSFRSTEAVEVEPAFYQWAMEHGDQYLRYKEPEPDKTAIKAAIKAGTEIPFAAIVKKQSLNIK